MPRTLEEMVARAVSPESVRHDGNLTSPRTYGVYALPINHGSTRRHRIGNHPVRQRELEVEYGNAKLLYLFKARPDAEAVAKFLDGL